MHIRTETIADGKAIAALTYKAFEHHPHHAPGATPTEHLIINALREQGALTLSLVAEDETGITGHIAFSPVTIDGVSSGWYGLGPVSVSPEHQRKGIGSQLIKTGIAQLKAQGAKGVVLLGEPAYYSRFGFQPHPSLILPGVPAEYFLALPLCQHANAVPAGEVAYHQAFSG